MCFWMDGASRRRGVGTPVRLALYPRECQPLNRVPAEGDSGRGRPVRQAVPVDPEPGRGHRVHRPGLEELLLAVLTTRTRRLVMVDPNRLTGRLAPPQETVARRGGERRVRSGPHRRDAARDLGRADERTGALQHQQQLDGPAGRGLEPFQRMRQGRLTGRGVARQLIRPPDCHRPGLDGQSTDPVVVGGDRDHVDGTGRLRSADHPYHQGDAADRGQVLAGDAFRAAPRRNHREYRHSLANRRSAGATVSTPCRYAVLAARDTNERTAPCRSSSRSSSASSACPCPSRS